MQRNRQTKPPPLTIQDNVQQQILQQLLLFQQQQQQVIQQPVVLQQQQILQQPVLLQQQQQVVQQPVVLQQQQILQQPLVVQQQQVVQQPMISHQQHVVQQTHVPQQHVVQQVQVLQHPQQSPQQTQAPQTQQQDQESEQKLNEEWLLSLPPYLRSILLQAATVLPKPQNEVASLEASLIQREEANYAEIFERLVSTDEFIPLDLLTAASIGDVSFVTYLIERSGVDPNMKNASMWTALMYASLYNHDSTVLYLLEMNCSINEQNPNGKSALMLAAMCGHYDIARILLNCGASIDQTDNNGNTALLLATSATHVETVLVLINARANLNAREKTYGFTPLHFAAQTGQTTIIRALLSSGADATLRTSSGDIAYHLAIRNGHLSAAALINQDSNSFFSLPNVPALPSSALAQQLTPNKYGDLQLPTQFKPKSPYSNFFENLHDNNTTKNNLFRHGQQYWPYTQVSSNKENTNPFTAWPGSSIIFKQATAKANLKDDHSKQTNECHAKKEACQLPKDLNTLLQELELSCYEKNFKDHAVTLQVFFTMTDEDMKEIGIDAVGPRRKLTSAIEYFKSHRNFLCVKDQSGPTTRDNTCKCVDKLEQLRAVWNDLKTATENLGRTGEIQDTQALSHLIQRGDSVLHE